VIVGNDKGELFVVNNFELV